MEFPSRVIPSSNEAESFRTPMTVTELRLFRDRSAYPVCPRCHMTLDREYQAFCDRCGQALNWNLFQEAMVVVIL